MYALPHHINEIYVYTCAFFQFFFEWMICISVYQSLDAVATIIFFFQLFPLIFT